MRFKFTKDPDDFERRVVSKFAWLPVEIDNHLVWLEDFNEYQCYRVRVSSRGYLDGVWEQTKRAFAETPLDPL